jgi:prevent-host-death family protein
MEIVQKISAVEAKTRLGKVIEDAQHQPVTITRNGRDAVVVMSARTYQQRQVMATKRLQRIMDNVSDQATDQGISETEINRLLKNES